jgi:hypothetical protein
MERPMLLCLKTIMPNMEDLKILMVTFVMMIVSHLATEVFHLIGGLKRKQITGIATNPLQVGDEEIGIVIGKIFQGANQMDIHPVIEKTFRNLVCHPDMMKLFPAV